MKSIVIAALVIAQMTAVAAPIAGRGVPDFAGRDLISGHSWRLSQVRKRRVALFFYCGCQPCHACARAWEARRSRAAEPFAKGILTVVVVAGDETEARLFASQTRLKPGGLVLIADPAMKLTDLYRVAPCPRAFAIVPDGRLAYTNEAVDDAPQSGSPALIAARTFDALRMENVAQFGLPGSVGG